MAGTVKAGESNNLEIRNRTVRNFVFKLVAKKTATNSAVLNTDFDLSQVTVSATLHRKGRQHRLFSGDLRILGMESALEKAIWDYVKPGSTRNTKLVPAAVGVSEVAMIIAEVDLFMPVNVSGKDMMILEINCGNRTFATGIDTSGSFVEFDAPDAVGLEYQLPWINQNSLQGGTGRQSLSLGDNVQRVVFLNTDKTTILEADAPIAQYGISTDRGHWSDNYRELYAKRVNDHVTVDLSDARCQSFELLSGQEFDKVELDLTCVPANVVTNNNWIIARNFTVEPEQVQLAENKRVIHQVKRLEKAGLATSNDRSAAAAAQKAKATLTANKAR